MNVHFDAKAFDNFLLKSFMIEFQIEREQGITERQQKVKEIEKKKVKS